MPIADSPRLQPEPTTPTKARVHSTAPPPPPSQTPFQIPQTSPEVDRLVTEIIGRVADKWTMLVLELVQEHGTLRFTRIGELIDGISQKMLTRTLRLMERDGLLQRTVFPVVPPHVEYRLTPLGESLSAAFCGVWIWAEKHHDDVTRARAHFDAAPVAGVPRPRVAVERVR